MLTKNQVTIYPRLRLVNQGKLLFDTAWNPLVIDATNQAHYMIIRPLYRPSQACCFDLLMLNHQQAIYCYLPRIVNLGLRRVQRHCRRWVGKRREARAMALMMAFHPRLGAHSPLGRMELGVVISMTSL